MATTTQALPAFSIYFWGLVDVPDTPGPAEPPFETPEMPGRAIPALTRNAYQDAQLLSPARFPLPRCHPGTRTSLIEEIIQRAGDQSYIEDNENYPLLWIYGPAGAGKTALAQTFGELVPPHALGAAFFFSQARNHNDPSRFWTSICHQILSLRLGSSVYNRLVAKRLSKNRAILEADIQTQFEELIRRPLSSDRLLCSGLVIIIDGLDECQGEQEQCQIIKCICDNLRGPRPLPIRWVVFSRPEPHLKRIFKLAESQGLCWTKEVVIDDPATQRDVRTYLRDGFDRIASRYRGIVDGLEGRWPEQANLDKIFKASSGLFVYAATVLKFVGNPISANPVSQLQAVIDFLDGSPVAPGSMNPLDYVDNLYRGLIEKTPRNTLPITLWILGTCAVCPPLPLLYFTHLLNLSVQVVYDALLSLHSIIAVPFITDIAEEPLRYFHASFPDFLIEPNRSGYLAQNPRIARLRLADLCFHAISDDELVYSQNVTQNASDQDEDLPPPLSISCNIQIYVSTHVWDICTQIPNPNREFLRNTLGCFDFRHLRLVMETISARAFLGCLRWLYRSMQKLPDLKTLVRTHPRYEMDTHFVEKIEAISQPVDLESQGEENELMEIPRYALVGFREQTVAVLITHETVMVYSAEDLDGL